MRLFTENGYASTTIPMIAEQSGVSRTSIFRYWGSKSEIVWAEFDRHIQRLGSLLEAELTSESSTLDIVRRTVVENLRLSMVDSGLWLERFTLVDTSAELRSEEALHWAEWAREVATFVGGRHGHEPGTLVPQSVAGAVQAAFLATLRTRLGAPGDAAATVLHDLDRALSSLGDALQRWVDSEPLSEPDR